MRVISLAVLALPIALANAFTITGPTDTAYWVQNGTNQRVTWEVSPNDPSTFNIEIGNINNATLNGNFSIATAVNATVESVLITNVTLKTGDNYFVQFVNISNATQIFAVGPSFAVKPPGTPLAPTETPSAPSNTTASTTDSSSTSAAATGASDKNAALSIATGQGLFGVLAACGIASLSAFLL